MYRLAAALIVFVACTPAAIVRQPGQSLSLIIHEDWLGFATCRTRPMAWVSEETPEADRGWVRAHEAEHVRHMATFENCEAFLTWLVDDDLHRIESEARAYCVGAKFEFEEGKFYSLSAAMWKHALVMGPFFGIGVPEAYEYIRVYCGASE